MPHTNNESVQAVLEKPEPAADSRGFRLASRLFPDTTGRSITWYGVLLGTTVGTVLSLFRTTGTGPLQTIFEEDARDILTVALDTSGLESVLMPVQGYFVVGPRLLGELATFFPVSWAAAVLSISSAMICGLLAVQVYAASGTHLSNRLARLAVAAPLLVAPVAETMFMEIYNRPVCLHFFAMYAMFWVLVWTPGTRAGRVGALVTVGMTAVSTALIVGYLPLAALRAFTRRDRLSFVMFGLVAAGSALQIVAATTSLGGVKRTGASRLDVEWALQQFAEWALPVTLFGRRSAPTVSAEAFLPTGLGILLAWMIVVLVVVVAVTGARRGLLRPAWLLAAALGGHSVAILALQIMVNGWLAQRYLMTPALLLIAALVMLLRPARGAGRRIAAAPLAVFCVFLLVVATVNYRNDETYRHDAPRWIDQVRLAARWCADDPTRSTVMIAAAPAPIFSNAVIPCHELRDIEPAPAWLGP